MDVIIILITIAIMLFIIISEIFTVLFRITGIPEKKAKFQTISLLTNCGYSTKESEIMMSVSSRRKLAKITMILGYMFSACFISAFVTLMFSLSQNQQDSLWRPVLICAGAIILLILTFKIKFIKRAFDNLIFRLGHKLRVSKTSNRVKVIDNYGQSSIVEIIIGILPNEFENKDLKTLKIKQNFGITVLAITRGSQTINNVSGEEQFKIGDIITLYGGMETISELFENTEIHNEKIKQEENSIQP
jgi:hypothetical protein